MSANNTYSAERRSTILCCRSVRTTWRRTLNEIHPPGSWYLVPVPLEYVAADRALDRSVQGGIETLDPIAVLMQLEAGSPIPLRTVLARIRSRIEDLDFETFSTGSSAIVPNGNHAAAKAAGSNNGRSQRLMSAGRVGGVSPVCLPFYMGIPQPKGICCVMSGTPFRDCHGRHSARIGLATCQTLSGLSRDRLAPKADGPPRGRPS